MTPPSLSLPELARLVRKQHPVYTHVQRRLRALCPVRAHLLNREEGLAAGLETRRQYRGVDTESRWLSEQSAHERTRGKATHIEVNLMRASWPLALPRVPADPEGDDDGEGEICLEELRGDLASAVRHAADRPDGLRVARVQRAYCRKAR